MSDLRGRAIGVVGKIRAEHRFGETDELVDGFELNLSEATDAILLFVDQERAELQRKWDILSKRQNILLNELEAMKQERAAMRKALEKLVDECDHEHRGFSVGGRIRSIAAALRAAPAESGLLRRALEQAARYSGPACPCCGADEDDACSENCLYRAAMRDTPNDYRTRIPDEEAVLIDDERRGHVNLDADPPQLDRDITDLIREKEEEEA